ncbi:MAG: hypothetical protein KKD48_03510 [Nanoarchaeota archaeon]|nr:hypothetical protein [Nanoarchaeota archaeon]
MKYEDLINSNKAEEFQLDKTYKELILPIKDPLESLDSIIEFVRIWNRRVPVGKNKDKIKEAVISLRKEFEDIKHYNLEDFEFTAENIEIVKKIFNKLSTTVLKSTGTTKLMHGMNPNLFVMWDKGICIHYGFYSNSKGYMHFMKLMQDKIQQVLKEHNKEEIIKETGVSLPKLIDEYNWLNFRTSKVV